MYLYFSLPVMIPIKPIKGNVGYSLFFFHKNAVLNFAVECTDYPRTQRTLFRLEGFPEVIFSNLPELCSKYTQFLERF